MQNRSRVDRVGL